jgi:uncharacterized Rmd1/YagE family protein
MNKTIPSFPAYSINENGQVFRKNGKPQKAFLQTRGYLQVSLTKDGREYKKFVHRLVLEAFNGSCPQDMQACHNNGIRTDNRIKNLRWDTPKNNQADRKKHGTALWSHKLNEKQVRVIKYCLRDGMTVRQLCKYFKHVSRNTLYDIAYNINWKHITIPT